MDKNNSTSKMHELVAEYHQSGQTQSAFAQAHGIGKSQLNYWIKKLERTTRAVDASKFAPVSVAVPSPTTSLSIFIRLNGVEIEIPVVCLP